jgi:hypothetical protein
MAPSAVGVGSGPGVQGIAQKLGAVAHQPRATLHARASHIGFQISALCTLEAAAASFREPAAGLVDGEPAGIFKPHTDGATVGAVDFTAIDISGGAESALVAAKNAGITQLGVLATLGLHGDYRPIRLLDIEGANLDVTFDSQLDPWPWEFSFSLEAPKGSTAHSMDCPSEPLPNAGSGGVKGAGNGLSDYKVSDPDAALELEGQFAVTRSSNSASDVTEGQRLEPERAGASIIGSGSDRSTAQCSAQAIAQSTAVWCAPRTSSALTRCAGSARHSAACRGNCAPS